LVVIWQIASMTGLLSPKILAAPSTAATTGFDMLMSGVLVHHLLASAQRAYLGLGIGVVFGLAFALIAGLMVVAGNQLAGLGAELPRYQTTVREKIGRLGGAGASSGTINRAFEAFEETGNELRNLGGSAVPMRTRQMTRRGSR
jgi:hypothetical protein